MYVRACWRRLSGKALKLGRSSMTNDGSEGPGEWVIMIGGG